MSPFEASAVNGMVRLVVDPATARQLVRAWAAAYAGGLLPETSQPRWHDDVITLLTAAATADVQAGAGPAAAQVPVRGRAS